MNLRSVPIVGLLVCGWVTAGIAPTQDDAVKLPPGKQAGTFRYEYQGRVRFSQKPKFPVDITLSPFLARDQIIAKKTVETEQPFLLWADLRPGTYIIRSTLIDKDAAGGEGAANYWDAFGPEIDINRDGAARRVVGAPDGAIVHKLKIKPLAPAMMSQVKDARPSLRWQAVDQAKSYFVGWIEEFPADRKPLKNPEPIRTDKPEYTFQEDLVPKRLYEWYVHAVDENGNTLGNGNAYFFSAGADRSQLAKAPPADQPAPAAGSGWIGVQVREVDDLTKRVLGADRGGLWVQGLFPDSPATTADLRVNDVVLAIDGTGVATVKEFIDRVSSRPPGTGLKLTIQRQKQLLEVQVTLGKRPELP